MCSHRFKRRFCNTPIEIVGAQHELVGIYRSRNPDRDHPLFLSVGKGAEEKAINNAENCSTCADPQGHTRIAVIAKPGVRRKLQHAYRMSWPILSTNTRITRLLPVISMDDIVGAAHCQSLQIGSRTCSISDDRDQCRTASINRHVGFSITYVSADPRPFTCICGLLMTLFENVRQDLRYAIRMLRL